MDPVHPAQDFIGESLNADREPVHTRRPPRGYAVDGDVFRIRLHRDFGIIGHLEAGANEIENTGNPFRAKPRWSAASEIDGRKPVTTSITGMVKLECESGDILIHGNNPPDRDGKIAVGAAPAAEGHVNVEMRCRHP